MSNSDVRVEMSAWVADALANVLDEEFRRTNDLGWNDLADMLRHGGRDSEVRVTRLVKEVAE